MKTAIYHNMNFICIISVRANFRPFVRRVLLRSRRFDHRSQRMHHYGYPYVNRNRHFQTAAENVRIGTQTATIDL